MLYKSNLFLAHKILFVKPKQNQNRKSRKEKLEDNSLEVVQIFVSVKVTIFKSNISIFLNIFN